MSVAGGETRFCEKCKKTMNVNKFYKSNNLEKYPDGRINVCKECLTMHVDNFNPDTFLWILQDLDVPYIPNVWNELLIKFGKDKSKLTGLTVLGRYLSQMQLNQYKKYRWKDTAIIEETAAMEARMRMENQGYSAAEIDQVLAGRAAVPTGDVSEPVYVEEPVYTNSFSVGGSSVGFEPEDNDLVDDLTDEDKRYLKLKWGKSYRPEEWIRLEQLYEEMINSYDIQSAGHIDTLKLVCKTSLKANQLLDIGDVDGAQKMIKMYDGLMKSGKFTAAQNKAETGEYVDSISELVAICESDGFIPRYYVDGPQDKVDRVLQDLQSYTTTLVTEEMNLGNLIENAVKQIEIDKIKEAEESEDEEVEFEDGIFSEDGEKYITEEDYLEFKGLEEEDEEADDEYLLSLLEEHLE